MTYSHLENSHENLQQLAYHLYRVEFTKLSDDQFGVIAAVLFMMCAKEMTEERYYKCVDLLEDARIEFDIDVR